MNSPSVSIFRPSRGKGQEPSIVWWMGWRDAETGKLNRVSTGAKLERVARQIASEKERQLSMQAAGLWHPCQDHATVTFPEAVLEFLAHQRTRNRPETATAYSWSLRVFERVMKPDLLRKIDRATLDNFVAKRSGVVEPTTINKDLRHVRALLRWAEQRHYLAKAPDFVGLFLPTDTEAPIVIPIGHYQAMMTAIGSAKLLHQSADWWRVFLEMAYGLGCRRGELLGITWGDIDLDAATIRVRGTISKGRRNRSLPLIPSLVATLRDWRQGSVDASPVLPCDQPAIRRLYTDWHSIQKQAGLPGVYTFHNCRSSCASQLIDSGASTLVVRDFLGHSSVVVTEKHYVRVDPKTLRSAAERRHTA